jgi:hypothetical protein
MSDSENAQKVFDALTQAKGAPTLVALPILNGLIGLVQGGADAPLEVEEARSSAFMAICEVGKALHRGQPTEGLYAAAIKAAEHWMRVAK